MERAERQIDIELYLVSSGKSADRVEAALIAAVQRGVQVRCLFDSFGSRGLRSAQRRRWQEAGIELRFYNPLRWTRGLKTSTVITANCSLSISKWPTLAAPV